MIDPPFIARMIANNDHSFDQHVVQSREFDGSDRVFGGDLGIRNRQDYESHILSTLLDESTIGFVKTNGHQQFYNLSTNTFVAVDKKGDGTCFRPLNHDAYLLGEFQKDVNFF